MEPSTLQLHLEALIFASEKPLTQDEMFEMLNNLVEAPIEKELIEDLIIDITEKYEIGPFPFELAHVGGGYVFLTKKAYHQTILQLNGEKHIKKLSTSAMETLAIISYKQPITKSEIEFIRGVNSDYSIQKLLEKELIVIAGRNEDVVGKPLIYATSKSFMDYLGINSAAQLPTLKEISNTEIVFPTLAEAAITDDMMPNVGDVNLN